MATVAPNIGHENSPGRIQRLLGVNNRNYNILVQTLKNFISELVSTGVLVFLGCMGVVRGLGQVGDHTGVVLSFSMAVFMAIQIGSQVSGGHVNPAVTIVSVFFKKITVAMAAVYIVAQALGGILGYGLLILITPSKEILNSKFEEYGMCTTVPHPQLTVMQALITEFILTSLLMLIVCSVWDPRNAHHDSAILKVGFAIFPLAYAGISYSGCSMNPARSLGPAVWNNSWKDHWIYWVGPLVAALFSGYVYTAFFCPKIETPKKKPRKLERPDA